MKQIGKAILSIFFLVVLTELAYWTTFDFVIYNDSALNNGFTLFYYHSAGLIALILSILLSIYFQKIPAFFRNLISLLVNTYALFSINQLILTDCDEIRNPTLVYSILIILTLICTGYFLIFKITTKMNRINIYIVAISTILLFADFLFFLVGFKVFY